LAEYKVRVNGSSFLHYGVKLLKILTKSFKALKVLLSLPPGLLGVGQGAASLLGTRRLQPRAFSTFRRKKSLGLKIKAVLINQTLRKALAEILCTFPFSTVGFCYLH
jgi:hypothetical protein